jgi:synaptobrevin family protein YKT6
MKVLALAVCKGNKILVSEYDLSSFSFFTRGSVQEGIGFFVSTIVERTQRGQRQTVQEQNYKGSVHVRNDGLAAVIVSDHEYPSRVAFSVLGKLMDEFSRKFPSLNPPFNYPELKDHLVKCQDPQSSDPFMKVQRELDETKVILVPFSYIAQDYGLIAAAW